MNMWQLSGTLENGLFARSRRDEQNENAHIATAGLRCLILLIPRPRMKSLTLQDTLLFLLLFMLLPGCSFFPAGRGGTVSVKSPDFFGVGEEISRQLVHNQSEILAGDKRLIMTTFVDIDDLSHTSRFGRVLAESLATRLFNNGFGVVEVRQGADLTIKKKRGEVMLTRTGVLRNAEHQAEGIVVGTYALTPTTVIINAKMLDAANGEVISVAGLELQRTAQIEGLLAEDWPERIGRLSAYER